MSLHSEAEEFDSAPAPSAARARCGPGGSRYRAWRAGLVSFALIGALAGCGPAEQTELDEADDADFASPADRAATSRSVGPRVLLEADFEAAEGSSRDIDGTVEVHERAGALALVVDLSGLPPGEHAWHIHEGDCASAGPVRLALSSTSEQPGRVGPVSADADGVVATTVRVPGLERSWIGSDRYSLHIHQRPGTDHGPTLACADL